MNHDAGNQDPMKEPLSKRLELQKRLVETADEYHAIAEGQWDEATAVEPTDDESLWEFRRLIRAALQFYVRAYLMLDMIETDSEQELEDLLEIAAEQQPQFASFFEQNNIVEVLDEESEMNISRIFAVAEALRSMLLEHSNQLAASVGSRFMAE